MLTLRAEPEILQDQPSSLVYPPFWHTPFGIHRGTPELLSLFVGKRTHFQAPQDLACTLLLSDLAVGAVEPEFRITVLGANTGAGNLIFNPDFTHLEVVGDRAPFLNRFQAPTGVAMSRDGLTLITDPSQPNVVCLKRAGQALQPAGTLPPPPGGWKKPWGIALDSAGRIYVTDRERNQLFIYSPARQLIQSLGPMLTPSLALDQPQAIAVTDALEPWSYYHNQALYILDQQGQRIIKLDFSGRLAALKQVSELGLPAATRWAWLELDYYENLWITDPAENCVHKLDRNLNYLTRFGQAGNRDGCFQSPTGIAIHRHFGQVFIAEAQGAHYFWIGADIQALHAVRENRNQFLRVAFFLTEPAHLRIQAVFPKTRQSALRYETPWMDSGQHELILPLLDLREKQAFILQFQIEATYSSASYKTKQVSLPIP